MAARPQTSEHMVTRAGQGLSTRDTPGAGHPCLPACLQLPCQVLYPQEGARAAVGARLGNPCTW